MGFLRRLFGGKQDEPYRDERGVYFYVQCDNCGAKVRVRADKQYDLNRTGDGYVWHKTIVDSKCFRAMPTVVQLDSNFQVTQAEIEGGHYISKEAYEAPDEREEKVLSDAAGEDDPRVQGTPGDTDPGQEGDRS